MSSNFVFLYQIFNMRLHTIIYYRGNTAILMKKQKDRECLDFLDLIFYTPQVIYSIQHTQTMFSTDNRLEQGDLQHPLKYTIQISSLNPM